MTSEFLGIFNMQSLIISVLLYLIGQSSARVLSAEDEYVIERNNLLMMEAKMQVGHSTSLSKQEIKANEILINWKRKEIDDAFENPQYYNFSKHFFTYKNDINRSVVYQLIKKMPKGAALHVHASMMLDVDSLLELTYEDHLYVCYGGGDLQFQFANAVPAEPCAFEWSLLSDLRNSSGNVTIFDAELRKYLTLYTEDKTLQNADINTTWERFEKVYKTVASIIKYRPVREKFIYKSLKNFYDDNVKYIEIRSGLHELHELDGTVHERMYFARLYEKVTKEFIKDYPDFSGIKLILTTSRWKSSESVQESIALARLLKQEMPDFFAGFDLVGQEDRGKPLAEFIPLLLEAKEDGIDFYFHGGETNWFGTPTDENLVDAFLLDSKRIGHAYALTKHPKILAEVKQSEIALEVNVISNVVLSLVRDVRNHPLAYYLADNLPVVLSSDDPGAWEADPMSHDFYVTFVGVASRQSGLQMLKRLALNSIHYSALNESESIRLIRGFANSWDDFIREILLTDSFETYNISK